MCFVCIGQENHSLLFINKDSESKRGEVICLDGLMTNLVKTKYMTCWD